MNLKHQFYGDFGTSDLAALPRELRNRAIGHIKIDLGLTRDFARWALLQPLRMRPGSDAAFVEEAGRQPGRHFAGLSNEASGLLAGTSAICQI